VCGRYAAKKDPALLAAEFDAVDATEGNGPDADYNVAPTKAVVALVQRHPRDEEGQPDPERTERSLRVMRWGLVPHWAKDRKMGAKMINARADSAATKPAFRSSVTRRRCILPADGWYEWKRDGATKQAMYMTRRDETSLAMAGLWSTWHDPNGDPDAPPLVSCAVLTTDALGQLTEVHDRMPLLLAEKDFADWLDPDRTDVTDLLAGHDMALIESLELRPVASKVNSVRNNGADLIARVDPAAPAVDLDAAPTLFDQAGTPR
jgi:putative SOS response-associated peptidase YedK